MNLLDQQDQVKFVSLLVGSTAASFGASFLLPLPGLAQLPLTPDNSLGAESSIVNPDGSINGLPATLIEGGATRGSNLLHSFQEFNVNTGQAVYFANPINIENILTRVTGGSVSSIDGVLGVDGAANLFLLNPNGVIFGPNATLDISGSFLTSTGSSFTFADGSEFSATPTGEELLTVSVPLGVQFNSSNPPQGNIKNQGTLEVDQNLTLIGNNLGLNGALRTSGYATAGNITLYSQGDITLTDAEVSSSSAISAGNIVLHSEIGKISLVNSNVGTTSVYGTAGGISLNTLVDEIYVGGSFLDSFSVFGNGGDISLTSEESFITIGGSSLNSHSVNEGGNGGNISLKSETGYISLGSATLNSSSNSGTSGNIVLMSDSGSIFVGGSNLNSKSDSGNGGNISLNSETANISLSAATLDSSSSSGMGGSITLGSKIGTISLGGANLSTGSNPGISGNITLMNDSGDIFIGGSQFHSYSDEGEALSFRTKTGNISLSQSSLSTGSSGGSIFFSSGEGSLSINNSDIYSGTGSTTKRAGDVTVITDSSDISITNSLIYSGARFGESGHIAFKTKSGNITLSSSQSSPSRLASFSQAGKSGPITMVSDTGNISLTNYELDSSIFSGDAGSILLQSNGGDISLSNASLDAYSFAGASGTISFFSKIGDISLDNSVLTASTALGTGGSISLNSEAGNIILDNSRLSSYSNGYSGQYSQGGELSLSTDSGDIVLKETNIVAGIRGISGTIQLSALDGRIMGTNAFLAAIALNPTGQGGTVKLEAKDKISGIEAITLAADGVSGNVTIYGSESLLIKDVELTSSAQFEIPSPEDPTKTIPITVGGTGQSGNVTVSSLGELLLENTQILSSANSEQPAGNIEIKSPVVIELINNATINSGSNASGTGGSIVFETPIITMGDGASIQAIASNTSQNASGGNITFITPNNSPLTIQGKGTIRADTESDSSNAGGLTIDAPQVTIDGIQLTASTSSGGKGGNIVLKTDKITFKNDGAIAASTSGSGAGGSVFITSVNDQNLTIKGKGTIAVESLEDATGNGGTFKVNANNFTLDGTTLSASTQGQGSGGSFSILATESIDLKNEAAITAQALGRGGVAGSIDIDTSMVTVEDSAVTTSAEAGAKVGNVSIKANTVTLTQAGEIAATNIDDSSGLGNVTLNGLTNLTVENSLISTSTHSGQAGSITIENDGNPSTIDTITLSGTVLDDAGKSIPAGLSARAEAEDGAAGGISVNAQQVTVKEGAAISATNIKADEEGGVTLRGLQSLTIASGGQVTASTESGQAGNVTVNQGEAAAAILEVSGEDSLLAAQATKADGSAGSVFINAADIDVSAGAISATNLDDQSATNLDDKEFSSVTLTGVDTLKITNGGQVTASTDSGQAGDVTVNQGEAAAATVDVSGEGSLLAAQATEAGGNAGSVIVNVADITVENAGTISATTIQNQDQSDPGSVILTGVDQLAIASGGQVTASTESGQAGNVTVNQDEAAAATVSIGGANSQLAARATGEGGSAGSVIASAQRITVKDGAAIEASNQNADAGGNITLRGFNRLEVDGGSITAKTNSGTAGSINITAVEAGNPLVSLTEKGNISVEANTGNAGGIDITTNRFQATDSTITVSSQQGAAGNLTITSTANGRADLNGFFLDNSELISRTAKNAEGDSGITLNISDFLIRLMNRSLISAEATGTATGGNVTINAPNSFILADAYNDNDIVAIADQGTGGRIEINAIRLFGFVQRNQATEEGYRNNDINDLSATSGVGSNGSVILNVLDIDPSQGLVELPVDLEDRTNQITPGCGLGNTDDQSEFIVTGRGGLPPNPSDPLSANGMGVPWVVDDGATATIAVTPPNLDTPPPLVEAAGIAIDAAGNAYFVTQGDSTVPAIASSPTNSCALSQSDS